MRASSSVVCLCGFVLVARITGQSPDMPARPEGPIVPLHQEPHHRQLFQHGPVRILELQLPPGDMSWFHSHEWPVLYVTLSNSQMRTQVHGQEWTGGGRGRGPAAGRGSTNDGPVAARGAAAGPAAPRPTSTTSYAQQPVTHRIENVGTTLVRNMIVVNETAGDETTTEQAAGFDATPELTNRWFRAYRIVLGPRQATASHRHRAPVAIIQATAGRGLGSGRATWEFNQPGQWAFFDADDAHDFRNVGDSNLELIEVEVRRK